MNRFSTVIAVFAALTMLGIGWLSYQSTIRARQDRAWVTHTHTAIELRLNIFNDIIEAETGQRGFILTGDEKYLIPYEAGISYLHRDIAGFERVTSDNRTQQDAIERLKPLVEARLAGLQRRLEIRKKEGLTAGAMAVSQGNDGEALMNQIRALIDQMGATEHQLLQQRSERAAAGEKRLQTVLVLGNVLAILFLTMCGSAVHRESVRRTAAERKLQQLNQSLERRSEELSETNHELESFSYSVAHDLRAPLRQISGYSGILMEDYAPQLEAEAHRLLQKVDDGARKMGCLVDDLLGLAKIGRQELSLQTTQLNSLLREVIEALAPEYEGREIEWQIGILSTAQCDPALMKQVFMNLLSNSVKYTRRRKHAFIQVGQTQMNGSQVIFVRDNGAGFDMQYVHKLFGVFQRLHKSQDFEGTGVGLAIVQRIIRKHRGRIWAEAELDRGATFYLTLGSAGGPSSNESNSTTHNEEIYVA